MIGMNARELRIQFHGLRNIDECAREVARHHLGCADQQPRLGRISQTKNPVHNLLAAVRPGCRGSRRFPADKPTAISLVSDLYTALEKIDDTSILALAQIAVAEEQHDLFVVRS